MTVIVKVTRDRSSVVLKVDEMSDPTSYGPSTRLRTKTRNVMRVILPKKIFTELNTEGRIEIREQERVRLIRLFNKAISRPMLAPGPVKKDRE